MRSFPATETARGAARRLAALALLALGVACTASAPRELRIRGELARGRYREAVEAAARGGDELLRHLDRGLALFYAGDQRASNLFFARAERLADERYTRSLSRIALSLLLNDTVLPYQPDPHERLLVPIYRALNHVAAGEPDEAAVEVRRLSSLLLERRDQSAERASREGDAFLSYLAGVLFDCTGRSDEALIAYRIAAEAYPGSSPAWPGASAGVPLKQGAEGELVLLVEVGFVAAPTEEQIFLFLEGSDFERARREPLEVGEELAKRYLARRAGSAGHEGDGEWSYLLPLALKGPPLPTASSPVVTLEIGGRAQEVPVAYSVSRAAGLSYEAEFPALLAKTAARTIAKTLAFKETTDDEGWVVRALANALHAATERADTRAWLSLPDEIRFVRIPLPAGRYDLRLRLDAGSGPRWQPLRPVRILPDHPAIVTARAY